MSINSTKEKHNTTKTKTKQKKNRGNKTKMGSLIRGGENPIPNQKTKGEKNIQKKTLQLARGLPNTNCLKTLQNPGSSVPWPMYTLSQSCVCGFKPRLRLSYYQLIVIQYPRCPDPNLEPSTRLQSTHETVPHHSVTFLSFLLPIRFQITKILAFLLRYL